MKKYLLMISAVAVLYGTSLQAAEAENASAADSAVQTYVAETPLRDYPELRRNGFFPFAVVSRVDANVAQEKFFGYTMEESLRDDLVDMLRHNINTWYNFCDGTDWRERLARCEEVGMRLIETRYCSFDFPPFETQDTIDFEEASRSPALLAWYGPDEPPVAKLPTFLTNKKRVYDIDPAHPYASAVVSREAQQRLAPAMEVMLANFYYGIGVEDEPELFLKHFDQARELRKITRGKRLWFMAQTFSNRHQNKFNEDAVPYENIVARYPNEREIRLAMNCIAAGGASGISFFIYNALVPYWGEYEVENFDYVLVDPWGNSNATYEEIAAFGDTIVPIMPSIMDADPSEDLQVRYDSDALILGQSANEFGTYLYFVNKSLKNEYFGFAEIQVPEGCAIYDLVAQEPQDGTLALVPGGGALLAVCTPEVFEMFKGEINGRREAHKAHLESLRAKELAAAGFPDGRASEEWLAAEKALAGVRAEFGVIHQMLAPAHIITKVYNAPELAPHKARLCILSRQYFQMKRELAKGIIPHENAFADLRTAIRVLAEDYRNSDVVVNNSLQ